MTDRELENVDPGVLTCDQVDERDLEAAYIAGRLPDSDAEAYEAHVFACDRCWAVLQTAQAVAAARHPALSAQRPGLPRWLALAAGITALVAGTWWVSATRQPLAPEALRGVEDSIAVQLEATDAGLALRFGAFPGADRYRIRVFSPTGELLAERETPDTTLEVSLDREPPTALLIEVTALDLLREPLASSGLVPLDRSSPRR